MPLKRQLRESEIPIFDNAYIHHRGYHWQLHMWLEREGKYARKSLRTRSQSTAVERAKQLYMEISAAQLSGKTYFSLTVKQGVAKYLAARATDVELGLITRDRYITLRSQLKHWQEFIGRETRLKELDTALRERSWVVLTFVRLRTCEVLASPKSSVPTIIWTTPFV